MVEQKELLSHKEIDVTIERLSQELVENHQDFKNTVIIGVQPRGVFLSNRITNSLNKRFNNKKIKSGSIDISFYRDDLRRREEPIVPKETDIEFIIEDKNVILVDDVLYTGRTIRSAIDAIMNFGRPRSIELLILINRSFSRHLPIQPDYMGKKINVLDSEKVIVEWKEINNRDRVFMINQDL
tara:strand:- start:3205 stop:3753 length:549 start_codon:yes stop_codon:yes gene_type:complete